MTSDRRSGSLARSAALIALATLAVHQLRYQLAYGSGAHTDLVREGHGYLLLALPVLAGFAIAILAAGLLRIAVSARPAPRLASPRARAIVYAASIVLVFAVQESAEGLLSGGHASGLDAVLGGGGWWALPLSIAFGALCACLDGGLARVELLVAEVIRPRRPRRRPTPSVSRRRTGPARTPLASSPLEFGLARRPPPLRA